MSMYVDFSTKSIMLNFFHQISYVLSRLEVFFREIEPEVEAISGEESDTQAFMKLMSIFNRVWMIVRMYVHVHDVNCYALVYSFVQHDLNV